MYNQTQLFFKNEEKGFRKILTNTFTFRNLIYNGRHFKWQCIISKSKLNTCAAIEGRCTLVVVVVVVVVVVAKVLEACLCPSLRRRRHGRRWIFRSTRGFGCLGVTQLQLWNVFFLCVFLRFSFNHWLVAASFEVNRNQPGKTMKKLVLKQRRVRARKKVTATSFECRMVGDIKRRCANPEAAICDTGVLHLIGAERLITWTNKWC